LGAIYDGFEGYHDLTESEIDRALDTGWIVLDTNVLLDLYAFEEPARLTAIELLQSVQPRLFVPNQVMREFWNNRSKKLYESRPKTLGIESLRQDVFALLNSLNPDKTRLDEIEQVKDDVAQHLDAISTSIQAVRGTPLNVEESLADTSKDPVLTALESILKDRVGDRWEDQEEREHIEKGLERFELAVPPGFKDAGKGGALQGTGDYLLWEQSLQHVANNPTDSRFVIVTGDSKADWRVKHPSGSRSLGPRPELVQEALGRTGKGLALLSPEQFYRHVGRITKFDEAKTESLAAASASVARADHAQPNSWSQSSYLRLLNDLADEGYSKQVWVLTETARRGGVLSLDDFNLLVKLGVGSSLSAFVHPIRLVHAHLVDLGMLHADSEPALSSVSGADGGPIALSVPAEIVLIQADLDARPGSTWLDHAEVVMTSDPERWWTPEDLVAEIEARGLRDLSRARTPVKTLRRDLAIRGVDRFESSPRGYKLRDVRP
jgi:hypothetical protein